MSGTATVPRDGHRTEVDVDTTTGPTPTEVDVGGEGWTEHRRDYVFDIDTWRARDSRCPMHEGGGPSF